jgi:DNA-binding beta-propeller fold protein YncE
MVPVGSGTFGVGVNPMTSRVYVVNDLDNTVSVTADAVIWPRSVFASGV